MLIAIDYDYTFTAMPEYWLKVIEMGAAQGIEWVCVTGRTEKPDFDLEPALPEHVVVICAGDECKAVVAERNGYRPNIWIDDMPGTIDPPIIIYDE